MNMERNEGGAVESRTKKIKYPKGVFYILPFYCFERLVYYGLLGGSALYLQQRLGYTAPDASSILSLLMSVSYFTPVIGAMIADVWLGKVRTVLIMCVFLCGGCILFTTSAVSTSAITGVSGLLMLGLSSGLIKAIIYSLGGAQFKLPEQKEQQFRYFSTFIWIRCLGYFLAITLMSQLRDSIQCFGDDCYLLPFSILSGFIIVGAWIFYLGRHLYNENAPANNTLLESAKCIYCAIKCSLSRGTPKKDHFLDHAKGTFNDSLIYDIKRTLRILVVFSAFPMCWALIYQSYIGIVFLAKRLDRSLGGFQLPPEMIVALNPLLSLILIPILRIPWVVKTPPMRTSTTRLLTAMVCLFLGFVPYTLLNMAVEQDKIPENKAEIHFYNTQKCPVQIHFAGQKTIDVLPQSQLAYRDVTILLNNTASFSFSSQCTYASNKTEPIDIKLLGGHTSVILILENTIISLDPTVEYLKDGDADAKVRLLQVKSNFDKIYLRNNDFKYVFKSLEPNSTYFTRLKPQTYEVLSSNTILGTAVIQQDGVYDIVAHGNEISVFEMTAPSSIHVAWVFPLYILITLGEIMVTVDTMDFAYSESPIQMKALLQAGQLFTTSIGLWILALLTKLFSLIEILNHKQSYQTIIYAILIAINAVLYKILLYRYQKDKNENDINDDSYRESISKK
ncbi:unnamed protein product, partial [Meganyctiphanes norvegica]